MMHRKGISLLLFALLLMSMLAGSTVLAQHATPVIDPPSPVVEPTPTPPPTVESTAPTTPASTPTARKSSLRAAETPVLTIGGKTDTLWANVGEGYAAVASIDSRLLWFGTINCAGATLGVDPMLASVSVTLYQMVAGMERSFRLQSNDDPTVMGNCVNVLTLEGPPLSFVGSKGPLMVPVGFAIEAETLPGASVQVFGNDVCAGPADVETSGDVVFFSWVSTTRSYQARIDDRGGNCVMVSWEPVRIPIIASTVCGDNNDTITLPKTQVGISVLDSGWVNNLRTITLRNTDGMLFVSGAEQIYNFPDLGDCETEPVVPPLHQEICGVNNDTISVPEQPANVVMTQSEAWSEDGKWTVTFSAAERHKLPAGTQTVYTFTDPGDCETEPVVPPLHQEICGVNNDSVTVPEQPVNVVMTQYEAWSEDGEWTVTFSAAEHYKLPADTQTGYTFNDPGDCLIDAPDAPVQIEACGPNNDTITMPELPENITLGNDTGWVENVRTITFAVAPNYTTDGQLIYEFTDAADPCPIDVVTVQFETSDGGSLEGTEFQIFAPIASMQAAGPYLEGVVSAENTAALQGLLPGSYRLTMTANGYEPVDTTIAVIEGESNQRVVVDMTAIAVPSPTIAPIESPEPTSVPTQTPVPTLAPTESPVPATPAPTATYEPIAAPTKAVVSALPSTGTGSYQSIAVLALAGLALLACAGLALMGRGGRRR